MATRNYANAPATTLSSGCTNSATAIVLTSVSGLPVSYPYILILDRGQAVEEVVLVTSSGGGTTLNVTRGYDSTTGFSHSAGALVEHGISAIDPREANTHVNATGAVHGLSGSVVGTTDTQTLTNKTMSVASNTFSGLTASRFVTSGAGGNMDSTLTKAIPAGVVVGDTDTQTLTNKTISADNNTLSGIAASSFVLSNGSGNIDGAAAQKVIPAGAVVGTSDTQTLTNKTLTTPTIGDFTNAVHSHANAAGGGGLNEITITNDDTSGLALVTNSITGTTVDLAKFQVNGTDVVRIGSEGKVRSATTTGGGGRALLPHAEIARTSATSWANNTLAQVTMGTMNFESDASMGDTAGDQLVFPVAGRYWVYGRLQFAGSNTGRRDLRLINQGGTTMALDRDEQPNATLDSTLFVGRMLDVAVNDTVHLEALQNSGGLLDIQQAQLGAFFVSPAS